MSLHRSPDKKMRMNARKHSSCTEREVKTKEQEEQEKKEEKEGWEEWEETTKGKATLAGEAQSNLCEARAPKLV